MADVTLFTARASISGMRSPGFPGRAVISPDPHVPGIHADAEIVNTVRPGALPGRYAEDGTQRVSWIVKVGGERIHPSRLTGPISVQLTRDAMATWSFGITTRGDAPDAHASPLGTWRDHMGAVPGLAEIDILGRYIGPDGAVTVPLVTGGQVHSSPHSSLPATISLEGGDREARYDRKPVTVKYPQGHGMSRGGIARRFATEAGIPSSLVVVDAGNRMYKRLDFDNAPVFASLRELHEPENRLIRFDELGRLVNPLRVGCDPSAVVSAEFDARDLIAGSAALDPVSDVPTVLCITGYHQIVRDAEGEGCGGDVTTIVTQDSFGIFAPRVAYSRQSSGGVVSATGWTQKTPALMRIKRVVTTTVYHCDEIASERVTVFKWRNPTTARYQLNSGLATYTVNGWFGDVYFLVDGVADNDNAEAYLWGEDRFVTDTDTLTLYSYREDDGYLVGRTVREGGWLHREARLKVRGDTSTTWESVNYTTDGGNPVMVRGNGVAVRTRNELYYGAGLYAGTTGTIRPTPDTNPLRRETEEQGVTEDGFVTSRTFRRSEWVAREAGNGLYLFAGNVTSDQAQQEFQEVEVEPHTFSAPVVNDGGAKETWSIERFGRELERHTKTLASYLPAADRRHELRPNDDLFEAEDDADPTPASFEEKQAFEREILAEGLLTSHPYRKDIIESPWAETPEEAEQQGKRIIREASALGVSFALPICFPLRPNCLVHLQMWRDLAVNDVIEVVAVQHQGSGQNGQADVTLVAGLLPVLAGGRN